MAALKLAREPFPHTTTSHSKTRQGPKCPSLPCLWAHAAPHAHPCRPAPPWIGWSRLKPWEGRAWFIRGGGDPRPTPGKVPPTCHTVLILTLSTSTCRSGEAGTTQCLLGPEGPPGVPGSGLQGTESERGGVPGRHCTKLAVAPPILGRGQGDLTCPPLESLTWTTVPALGPSPHGRSLTPAPSGLAHSSAQAEVGTRGH